MAGKFKFRDAEGTEHDLDGDRIQKLSWQGADGERHEVEGHAFMVSEHEVEEPFRVTYLDDSGSEQEVEGHGFRWSDVRLKRHVAPLGDALSRLREVTLTY